MKRVDLSRLQLPINWTIFVLAAAVLLLSFRTWHEKDTEASNELIPIGATEFILHVGIEGRMFNTYHFGGYLIQRLFPRQLVFADGRGDMYGDAFMREYAVITMGLPGWERRFDRYQVDYLMIENGSALRQLLLCRGDFRLVYDDADSSVLVKDTAKYAAIIREYGHPRNDGSEGRCAPMTQGTSGDRP